VLPFAFVGVYPASYFLRKEVWYAYAFATPVIGVSFFVISVFIWNQGVKRYRGAGN
jgi:ABC-2 type transport system permease protein